MGCHYCGTTDEELRPYGPGAAPICFPCMKADPQREAAAKAVYATLLEAEAAATGTDVVVLGLASVAAEMMRQTLRRPGQPGQ